MEQTYRFPAGELLRYRQITEPTPGKDYVIAIGTMQNHTGLRYKDYALRAKACRDGLETVLFDEEPLRGLKSDRELTWTLTEEESGCFALYSKSAKKYLFMDGQGARLRK